jgi:dihydroneopterin aldolase
MPEPKLQALSKDLLQSSQRHQPSVAEVGIRHVFVRDLVLPCNIGVHRHERDAPQRVRINLDLAVREDDTPIQDSIANVVCYEEIATGVRAIVGGGHINLVETLAERLAAFCLKNPRIETARVRVEKLDVFPDVASVGVEIVRTRSI